MTKADLWGRAQGQPFTCGLSSLEERFNYPNKHGQLSENEEATPNDRHLCQETNARQVANYSTKADRKAQPAATGIWKPLLLFSFLLLI